MKKMFYCYFIKQITILIGFLFICIASYSSGVKLLSKPGKYSISLRWAPDTYESWKLGNEYGYIIERYTVLIDGEFPDSIFPTRLNKVAMSPQPIEEWEEYIEGDDYVGIAASCIYESSDVDVYTTNPVLIYKHFQEKTNRYGFALLAADQSVLAAKLSGLFYEDIDAKENEKYLYKVFINTPDSLACDTGTVFTGLSEYVALPRPLTPEAEWDDKKVELSWNINLLSNYYNTYFLEKSVDGGKSFYRTTEKPIIQMSDYGVSSDYMYKTDSLDNNVKIYYYRIRGIDAFGEIGPPSDSIFGHGIVPIKSAPVIIEAQAIDNDKVKLLWEYPDSELYEIDGFKIYRSLKPRKKKELIYAGKDFNQREFLDLNPKHTNYYLISAYNSREEKISYIESYAALIDSIPPLPPINLVGEIDTLGNVKISWDDNLEEDLIGYRVYSSNHSDYEFVLRTPQIINNPLYNDSINIRTLTSKIYYTVVAVDHVGNHSAHSEILTLIKPNVLPPLNPRILSHQLIKKSVELEILPSLSEGVESYVIMRKSLDDEYFVEHEVINGDKKPFNYYDRNIKDNNEYSYYVIAINNLGIKSKKSKIVSISSEKIMKEKVSLRYEKQADGILLKCNIDGFNKEIERVMLYRSDNSNHMRILANTKETIYLDNNVVPGDRYEYAIKAIFIDGSFSPLSNVITTKF